MHEYPWLTTRQIEPSRCSCQASQDRPDAGSEDADMASPAPSTVDISDDDVEAEDPTGPSEVVDGCDEGQPVEHVPERSELDVGEGEADKASAPPKVGKIHKGKSHVFNFVPQPQDSQDPNTPEAAMEIDPEEEKKIAEDKKLPLHPPPTDMFSAELKKKIRDLRKEQKDLKSQKLARESALADVAGKVINVEESLPYGRDTAETMDMGDVDNLIQKFNQVENDLDLQTTDDTPARCCIKLNAPFCLWPTFVSVFLMTFPYSKLDVWPF